MTKWDQNVNGNVAVVIVAFNPEMKSFGAVMEVNARYARSVVVVDNSTDTEISSHLNTLIHPNLIVEGGSGNSGVGAAQNRGMRSAFRLGAKYCLLLDQDSQLGPGVIAALVETHRLLLRGKRRVACVVPAVGQTPGARVPVEPTVVREGQASGMLVSKQAFEEVGPMDESLFIDLVDYEWCWRARKKGYLVFQQPGATIRHRLGEDSALNRLGIHVPAPIRHYYQFRNHLLLMREKDVPAKWKVVNSLKLLAKLAVYPILLDSRLHRLFFIRRGIIDGVRNIRGEMASQGTE